MAQRPNVVISSTARDLPEHRKQVSSACERLGYFPLPMENLPASPDDAVRVSLALVDKADIYLGIFAHRYGYVPAGGQQSITEMEYERARGRGLPCLIYFMHEEHPIRVADVETGTGAEALRAFKERLATAHVAGFFKNADDLRGQVTHALATLKEPETPSLHHVSAIPSPPEVYVAHPYTLLQTRQLVGRQAELNLLTDWVAAPAVEVFAARVLCLVALGGMGKSALTWKWFHDIAPLEMKPLAGRLWWSFYESDASFDNFLTRATAYVTRRPRQEIEALPRPEVERLLLQRLDREPYLFVLDGLERALVAYARFDAAHLADEAVDRETDNRIGGPAEVSAPHRLRKASDPRAGKFLRQLAQVRASRILVSSRLYPSDLQNTSGQALSGCAAHFLTGLSDDDALGLWRALEVTGARERLLPLFHTFGSHPLLVQALAGAIANYRPAPGDFERWRRDHPEFDPFRLPLTQVKTHVLQYALAGLGSAPRRVLESVAGFRMPASYETVAALHVGKTCPTTDHLHRALEELEDRGLLGWDRRTNRYDLHPIVRGVVWSSLSGEARRGVHEALSVHFGALPFSWHEEVMRIEALAPAIELFNSLIGLGRFDEAQKIFTSRLDAPLLLTLAANRERSQLLEMFFPRGIDVDPELLERFDKAFVLSSLALSYDLLGGPRTAQQLQRRAVALYGSDHQPSDACPAWTMHAQTLFSLGAIRKAEQWFRSAYHDGGLSTEPLEGLVAVWKKRGAHIEMLERAERRLEGGPSTRFAPRLCYVYRITTNWRARHSDPGQTIRESDRVREPLVLLVAFYLQGQRAGSEDCLTQGLRLARDLGVIEDELTFLIGLADLKHRHGDPAAARTLLAELWEPAEAGPYPLLEADGRNLLATLEREVGNLPAATAAALRAYRLAWCDGPPFAYQDALDAARGHLAALGVPEPDLPPFDEARFPPLPEISFDTPDPLFDE